MAVGLPSLQLLYKRQILYLTKQTVHELEELDIIIDIIKGL